MDVMVQTDVDAMNFIDDSVSVGQQRYAFLIKGMSVQFANNCTTAAIQIKGTSQWLYCISLEYLPGQQIM